MAQLLRLVTRLSEKGYWVARIRRSRRWVQTCKAIPIQPDLILTPNITTESELPMEHLIPITRTNRLLRLSRNGRNVIWVYPTPVRTLRISGRPDKRRANAQRRRDSRGCGSPLARTARQQGGILSVLPVYHHTKT